MTDKLKACTECSAIPCSREQSDKRIQYNRIQYHTVQDDNTDNTAEECKATRQLVTTKARTMQC